MNPILTVLTLAALGCASNVERHWGEAYTANTEAQVANPVAALRNADREVGALDGTSADNAATKMRHHESDVTASSILRDVVSDETQ